MSTDQSVVGRQSSVEEELRRHNAKIAAMPQPVAVKPLDWREDRISSDWPRYTAESVFGWYEVFEWSGGGFGGSMPGRPAEPVPREFSALSLEAAKAAAQADYERRICSCLTTPAQGASQETVAASRDWDEDRAHENGNYMCRCVQCGNEFIGHKRRVICKVCSVTPAQGAPQPSEEDDLKAAREAAAQACAIGVTSGYYIERLLAGKHDNTTDVQSALIALRNARRAGGASPRPEVFDPKDATPEQRARAAYHHDTVEEIMAEDAARARRAGGKAQPAPGPSDDIPAWVAGYADAQRRYLNGLPTPPAREAYGEAQRRKGEGQ